MSDEQFLSFCSSLIIPFHHCFRLTEKMRTSTLDWPFGFVTVTLRLVKTVEVVAVGLMVIAARIWVSVTEVTVAVMSSPPLKVIVAPGWSPVLLI